MEKKSAKLKRELESASRATEDTRERLESLSQLFEFVGSVEGDKVKNGMRDEPRRCSSPHLKANRRSNHTDAESCAEEHLNKPNIADEVLIKWTSVGHAGTK